MISILMMIIIMIVSIIIVAKLIEKEDKCVDNDENKDYFDYSPILA